MRYCFYIDGINMHYALTNSYHGSGRYQPSDDRSGPLAKFMWLNYRKYCEGKIRRNDEIAQIYYFTAIPTWKPEGDEQHIFCRALKAVGIKVITGRFHNKPIKCHVCGEIFNTHEEKRTDVNLAVQLIIDAINNEYDRAVVISADSDLVPAISAINISTKWHQEVGIIFPIGRTSGDLMSVAKFQFKMKVKDLAKCQLDDVIAHGGRMITKPKNWI